MNNIKGILITLEGPDGSGKGTQSRLIVNYLKRQGFDVLHTREPGGTAISELIRKILLDPKNRILPLTELFLYEACRVQHTKEKIIPALRKKKLVICERYTDASMAYQGYGRGLKLDMVRRLNDIATYGIKPDLTLILDLDVKTGLKRVGGPERKKDRLEKENMAFHKRIRDGYICIARLSTKRVKLVKVTGIEETQKRIREIVLQFIRRRRKRHVQ